MSKFRVLLTRPLPGSNKMAQLTDVVDVVNLNGRDPVPDDYAEVDGAIIVLPNRLSGDEIRAASRLRVVASFSAGTDHIDVVAATERGVAVVSGQGGNANGVAEYTVALAISAHRWLLPMSASLEAGQLDWQGRIGKYWPMQEFAGSTLGLVGYGYTARAVEQAAAALGAKVIVFDPYVVRPNSVGSLDKLMTQSDTVSIHVPFNEQTRGLIGEKELLALGANGVLVQASRGGVVNLEALAAVLKRGALKWAVLDVFDVEPPSNDVVQSLVSTGRVTLTPHCAGVSAQGLEAMAQIAIDGVLGVLLRGEQPATTVNPKVFSAKAGSR